MKRIIFSLLLIILSIAAVAQNYCAGHKKDGTPCHMKVTAPNIYCRYHDPNAYHCAGVKKDGTPCKMIVSKPGEYCHYHSPTNQTKK